MIDFKGLIKAKIGPVKTNALHNELSYILSAEDASTEKSNTFIPLKLLSLVATESNRVGNSLKIKDLNCDPQILLSPTPGTQANHAALSVKIEADHKVNPKLYVDYGAGFEEDKVVYPHSEEDGTYRFSVYIGGGVKQVRLDPDDTDLELSISDVKLTPLHSHTIASAGLKIYRTADIVVENSDGLASFMSDDPIIEFRIDEEIKRSKFAIVRMTAKGLFGLTLKPKIYLGPNEASALILHPVDDVYTAIISTPSEFDSLRIDPAAEPGTAMISNLEAAQASEKEVRTLLAGLVTLPNSSDGLTQTLNLNRIYHGALHRRATIAGGKVLRNSPGRLGGIIWGGSTSIFQPFVEAFAGGQLVAAAQATPVASESPYFQSDYIVYDFDLAYSTDRVPGGTSIDVGLKGLGTLLEGTPLVAPNSRPAAPSLIEVRRQAALEVINTRFQLKPDASLVSGPKISILTPVYNVHETWLSRMIESVLRQSYTNWELVLVDDKSTNPSVRHTLEKYRKKDKRIKVVYRDTNGGISAATNDALKLATGTYIALVDNDDMITCDALDEMAKAINENESPDWLYSDECKIDKDDRSDSLFAKPSWSPLFLLNYMYTGHLSLYKRDLIRKLGGFRTEYDFSQDYDLALRVSEVAKKIVHVEKCLYGWRMIEGSGAQGGKPTARISNIAALQSAVDRRGWGGKAVPLPTANRVVRECSPESAKISIVVPSDDTVNISNTIESIKSKSSYTNFEIVVVTNSLIVEELQGQYPDVKFVRYDKPYNFSDKCNAGAEISSGEYLAFFNDDVRVVSADWMECLLEYLTLPNVGIVGPKLVYENGYIQHAGMVTGVRRLLGTAFHAYPKDTSAHFNMAQTVREVSLICGALLAISAKVFKSVGGFDAVNTPINHSDVDLCFKVRDTGLTCVYTPHAELIHIGHMSLAVVDASEALKKKHKQDKADIFILERWGNYLSADPYFTRSMRDLIYLDSQEPFGVFSPKPGVTLTQNNKSAVLVSHDLTPSGAPKIVFDMALSLQAQGYFVTVISPIDGPFREKLLDNGITVIVDALILHANENSLVIVKNFDKIIVNTILGWKIIQSVNNIDDIYWYIHETELVSELAQSYEDLPRTIREASNIWCGSKLSADIVSEYGGKTSILPYGVDKPQAASPESAIRIAVFGSYEPRKGQDLAVLGFKELPPELREKARLVLFGRTLDPHFKGAIEDLAKDVKEIEFASSLTYSRYLQELQSADVVLVSSRDDTLPLVSLDALASGKILVCGQSTGTSEYLVDGVSGIVYDENRPSDIAAALKRVIEDAKLRSSISASSKGVFERYFTTAAFRETFTNLIS